MSEFDDLYAQLPHLEASNHQITSPKTDAYNCVAWVERDLDRWWEPGFYWPRDAPLPNGEEDVDCYVELFRQLGFEPCDGPELEMGFLKIAIYAENDRFHHVAKQLPSGRWSSKAGNLHDFRHDQLDALEGAVLLNRATPAVFMRRRHEPTDTMCLEETGLIRV